MPTAELNDFTRRFFGAMGARVQTVPSGLRVELTREQLALLENRPLWSFGGRAASEPGLVTLYFAFDERAVEQRQPCELLTPGSPWLDRMCALALRECALAKAFIRPAPGDENPLRPFMVFHFAVSYVGHDVRDRIASFAVDLVDGDAFASPSLLEQALEPAMDGVRAEAPRLSVGDAHERAVEALCDALADEDASWYLEKRRWMEEELDRLYEYLRRASAERPPDESAVALTRARVAELRELARPRVEVRARAATLLYAPAYWPNPCSMYLSRRKQ